MLAYDVTLFRAGEGRDEERWRTPFLIDLITNTNCPMIAPDGTGQVAAGQTAIGIARFAVAVDDLDRAYEFIRAKAPRSIIGPPETWDYGPEAGAWRTLLLRGPDGMIVELVQPDARERT
jgi:hypothetical protein